jgi:hypothetical protein
LDYLRKVLLAVLHWTCEDITVHIDTNDLTLASTSQIEDAVIALRASGVKVEFHEVVDLADPFHLTWAHKDRLRDWVTEGGREADLFLYTEDDIVFTDDNLRYFSETAPILDNLGLMPGFLLYEWEGVRKMAVSYSRPQRIAERDFLVTAEKKFISPTFPYWAGFIFNRSLAKEYLASNSSRLECGAQILPSHSCRVHSAMGLCYENIPEPFSSRFLVPVSGLRPDPNCLVWHCAQNYSRTKKHNFASVQIDKMFMPRGPKTAIVSVAQRGLALGRYLKQALYRNLARYGLSKDTTYLDRYTRY